VRPDGCRWNRELRRDSMKIQKSVFEDSSERLFEKPERVTVMVTGDSRALKGHISSGFILKGFIDFQFEKKRTLI
jgi:hypothetical protein